VKSPLLALLSLVTASCNSGVADGVTAISDGYVFYDTGSNGRSIRYEENIGWYVAVIDERVDNYVVEGDRILVARRPAKVVTDNDVARWELSPTCEYWEIELPTRVVRRLPDGSPSPSLRCNPRDFY
jgi:hypothetical protein